jgi:lipoprotein-anchoring transpeptidase ErfK/SrfK
MSLINWLKKRSKIEKTGFVVFSMLFFLFAVWFVVFAYASIDVSPNRFQILNNASPAISVDWPYAIGTRLQGAKVTMDGKDISDKIKFLPRGFTFKSKNDFDEGEHIVQAKLKYGLLFPKTIILKWHFKTDTVPPEVNFDDSGSTVLATSEPNMVLNGTSEPYSEMEFYLNGKSIFGSQVGENGKFSVTLNNLNEKNIFIAKATDKAGNKTKIKLPVVVDKDSPRIRSFSPAPNSTVHGTTVAFNLKLSEKESEIMSVSLKMDGKQVPIELDKNANEVEKNLQVLNDGVHKVSLAVKDAAGNVSKKKWNFNIDTTKIIVDKSETTLYVYKKGRVVKTFRVAVGQPAHPTPAGHWKVVAKTSMPTWHNPHSGWSSSMPESIPPGYSNPLGLRAIYLDASGIRIHGTSNIGSIGSPASHGCIRVANPQIVVLYPLINVGTPVDVVP